MRWKIDRTHESFFLDWRHGNRCPGACSGIALATLAFGDDLDDPPCPYLARKDVPPSLALKYDCTAKSLHETRDACMTTPFPPPPGLRPRNPSLFPSPPAHPPDHAPSFPGRQDDNFSSSTQILRLQEGAVSYIMGRKQPRPLEAMLVACYRASVSAHPGHVDLVA